MFRRAALAVAVGLVLAALPGTRAQAGGEHWAWPTEGRRIILKPFLAPPSPYAAGHRGVDLAAGGTTVRAPADGVVHFAGMVAGRPVLSIEQAGGVLASLEPVRTALRRGDRVRRGEVVGVLLPGHCAALCLHLGARRNGQYLSPLLFLGGLVRPVLLPIGAGLPLRRADAPGDSFL
ncbi:M23 family metallopeptidase [Galbitalea soli]|uniref:M23 family metallopeptidase n=1 Tax=Galbitalea soli TaxID=1268042 RepID=A0A7C9PNN2_9MICO|nr:M23 family metallopeptidase [Galbitalea soli]